MRFFRLTAITVLLLACVVLGSACAGAKGEEGIQGPKGDTGAAGVGVQNIVNNGNGTFTVNLTNGTAYTTDNLTGPKGEQGEQGPQGIQGLPGTPGIGVEWVGEWDSATLYGKYDGVGYQGSSYISKHPDNTNHLPTDTNWWDLWVEKGDTGATGAAGADGADGAPGADGQDGAPGPNMIIAMGWVNFDGTLLSGYNVTYCGWYPVNEMYVVGFAGTSSDPYDYIVLVTPNPPESGANYCAAASNSPDAMTVFLTDNNGVRVQWPFRFAVLQLP